jgi:hypothetical protein
MSEEKEKTIWDTLKEDPNEKHIENSNDYNKKEKTGFRFIPIDVIDAMLDKQFDSWTTEIVGVNKFGKDTVVCVNLTVQLPKSDQTITRAGVGSASIQDASQSFAMAKSLAVKNAATSLGNIFGRALNREIFVDHEKGKVSGLSRYAPKG